MSITEETRRESHNRIIPRKHDRRMMVLSILRENGPLTAEEIADELYRQGEIPFSSRTFTAPRLTELKDRGIVETIGKRESRVSGHQIAIWRVVGT